MSDSPWLNAKAGGSYINRSQRFVIREIKAGRLRGARIGGRGEILTRREWLDQWVEDQAQPIAFTTRHKRTA